MVNVEILKSLLCFTCDELFYYLHQTLKMYYGENHVVYKNKQYLVAEGEGPLCLVAHMDTVWDKLPSRPMSEDDIVYDKSKNVMMGMCGLGADDRAGVYAILHILTETELRPSIIFTLGEEVGGIGAFNLISDYPKKKNILPRVRAMIEIDRKGFNESVYYDCNNKNFEKWINSFGFRTHIGSFTDIRIISPRWDIPSVNLSAGYVNEHCLNECLYIDALGRVISKIIDMLRADFPKRDMYFNKYYNKILKKGAVCPICDETIINRANACYIGDITENGLNHCCQECYSKFFLFDDKEEENNEKNLIF